MADLFFCDSVYYPMEDSSLDSLDCEVKKAKLAFSYIRLYECHLLFRLRNTQKSITNGNQADFAIKCFSITI